MEPATFRFVVHCPLSGSKAARIWSKPPCNPDRKNMRRCMFNKCDTRPDHVRNLVDKVALGQVFLLFFFFFKYFGFQMPLWFHQCSVLICIHKLLLREGQMDEDWELFKQQCSYGKWRALERKFFPLLRLWSCNVQFRNVNWRLRMQKMNNKIRFPWKINHNSTRRKKDTHLYMFLTNILKIQGFS